MRNVYPYNIIRYPDTEGISSPQNLIIEGLPQAFSSDMDDTIKQVKSRYYAIENDSLTDAIAHTERCLFRLYEAKYLVCPHYDIDLLGFVFDDKYHDFCVQEASAAYDSTDAEHNFNLAQECIAGNNYFEAGNYYKKAALQGHIRGQYNYGVTLSNGESGEKDPLEGAFWYYIAAKKGISNAMINLAIDYRNGVGVHMSGMMMIYWYAKGAILFNPYAVNFLGMCLADGEVISGLVPLGKALRSAAENLDDPDIRNGIQNHVGVIIEHIEKNAINI